MSVDYVKMLKKSGKLPVNIDLDTLDLYCEYLLNYGNKSITYSNLTNLKEYFSRVEGNTFKQNEAKMARYLFITLYLEARLDKGAVSHKICIKYVLEHASKRYAAIIKREIVDGIPHNKMQHQDIEFINSMLFSQLNVIFMHDYKGPISKLLEDLNINEFGKDASDGENAIRLFQSLLSELTKAQNRSRKENRFSLSDENNFNTMVNEGIERALSSSHYLQTGWQGLNKMLNGGFEDARLYNFIGATGGFKSGLLLNIMKQIKLYNKGRPHKDPTKRPTILFLSQENNVWETFLRIFGIFGTTENIKNFNAASIVKILKKGGFCAVQDEFDIDIEFRYYGNMDISVPDIKGIVQELDNMGKEVIIIIQDYIERLRPPVMSADKRNQLADISNQMHDLAIELDIPFITASQFNREGVATIEDQRNKKNADIGKKVGSANVSESFGMLKNFDMNISIVIEFDEAEKRYYLSFRRLKFRGDDSSSLEYFLHPFRGQNSKIQLMDDIHTEPLYRLSMMDEISAGIQEDVNEIRDMTIRQGNIKSEDDMLDEDMQMYFSKTVDDMNKSKASQVIDPDPYFRDENGFIRLIRKSTVNKALKASGIIGKKSKVG